MKAIILVAGVGNRLRNVTEDPKCLLKINGVTLLERYLSALDKVNVRDIVFVVGYKEERIRETVEKVKFPSSTQFIQNPYFTKGSILSLYSAKDELDEDILLMDGDVYFDINILQCLLNTNQENVVAIDTTSTSSGEEMMVGVKGNRILDMRRTLSREFELIGEAVGFYRLNKQACQELKKTMEEYVKSGKHELGYEDILPFLFEKVPFFPVVVDGMKWVEIDFEDDIVKAENLTSG